MLVTCSNVLHMARMVQIRNVPDVLHRRLKVRAAEEGMSLSDFLLEQARIAAEQPTVAEVSERLERLDVGEPGSELTTDAIVDIIRRHRDA